MKIIRWILLFGVVFGLGYFTGQQPEVVKQAFQDLSGEVLENTIGLDQGTQLKGQLLKAKEGFLEGKSYLLENRATEASWELERAVGHLDQAMKIDPEGPMAQKIDSVKLKMRELQQYLAEGQPLPPHILENLREMWKSVLP